MQEIICPYCNSKNIKKSGKRKGRSGKHTIRISVMKEAGE
jgi:transposase-like protein